MSTIPTTYFNTMAYTSTTDTVIPKLIALTIDSINVQKINYNYDALVNALANKANVTAIPSLTGYLNTVSVITSDSSSLIKL